MCTCAATPTWWTSHFLDREDLSYNSASTLAVQEAMRVAGVGLDDIATFDLYSCFPVPVFNFCDGTGLATDDPRGVTLTGGLPCFGGPATATRCTASPRRCRGCVLPRRFRARHRQRRDHEQVLGRDLLHRARQWTPTAVPSCVPGRRPAAAPVTELADGPAIVETYTVRYDWPVRTGIVVGRLEADGSRFLAMTEDPDLVGLLSDGDPLGAEISVANTERKPGVTALTVQRSYDSSSTIVATTYPAGHQMSAASLPASRSTYPPTSATDLSGQPEQHLGDPDLRPVLQLLGHRRNPVRRSAGRPRGRVG